MTSMLDDESGDDDDDDETDDDESEADEEVSFLGDDIFLKGNCNLIQGPNKKKLFANNHLI
jgi:hypothetical protein